MKTNLFIKILLCSFMTLCSLEANESISLTQTKNLIIIITMPMMKLTLRTFMVN